MEIGSWDYGSQAIPQFSMRSSITVGKPGVSPNAKNCLRAGEYGCPTQEERVTSPFLCLFVLFKLDYAD